MSYLRYDEQTPRSLDPREWEKTLERVQERLVETREVLAQLEWLNNGRCPLCGRTNDTNNDDGEYGHAWDCPINEVLK
jgi:hypothetical protein